MELGPRQRPPARRLVGLGGFLTVLRNLGALGVGRHSAEALHFTADDEQPIPVWVQGQGAPVVFIHGLGCSHRQWMPVARRLGKHARLYAWDARCHGGCERRPGAAISLSRLAADLQQLLDAFDIERATLVGHSMGALTAMQYLQDFGTARVKAVCFVDQSPRIVTDEDWRLGLFGGCSRETLRLLIGSARTDLAALLVREIDAATGGHLQRHEALRDAILAWLRTRLGGFDPRPLLDLAESLADADFRGVLTRLDRPVWVVLGARSAHYADVPLEAYYRNTIPHASVSLFERSGHSPHVAEPARFAQELLRFLADHD
jgi:pimeloyl-ACP methyl ester carboxylesterase